MALVFVSNICSIEDGVPHEVHTGAHLHPDVSRPFDRARVRPTLAVLPPPTDVLTTTVQASVAAAPRQSCRSLRRYLFTDNQTRARRA